MKHDLYKMSWPEGADEVLENLQEKVARGQPGCTVVGNRLTVRWNQGDRLVSVHAVIVEVDDGKEGLECPHCEEFEVYEIEGSWRCRACGWSGNRPSDHACFHEKSAGGQE